MADVSPWLSNRDAVEFLKEEFNVDVAVRTIDNKCYSGEIPSVMIAGQRRIHKDKLRKWALGDAKKKGGKK